jgi:RNA polymerase-binding transcription factor DksA
MRADLASSSPHSAAGRDPDSLARHLHPAALPQWHALLGFLWQERLERITELSLAYHDAEDAASDVISDRETRQAARRQASRILRQTVTERRALAEIEAALNRLTIGRFGWCEQCGGVITTPRLAETPQARYCASCDC